ncbi:uncharacterized protein LOC112905223 [Agrilus planipennis]|uniref:Uncharacterized protein LOC112905223 n=1 Tax=Agrilus planipennis TaxID=224129 RepID=A0A7F5RAK0_AGRPL|nr:uncharacterized protein LOC112905223 [Agrilus planipennis]XP_025832992.1 uncharacterized protein LOC112905223 [Agrilus planipennis]XP_025832993.1 uncharacterized protein LOC112905223 [Agrilus planipennis]XP_025832994.1 uncharacterized protein LOC112905223 [Agrilus planipennis]XP_025832995.1 uncharacterized protein LOC112905223 [Agrilus planipennis]XP_025832996.1 uncharacterized protein LOC112905223 [Agrilus planipennis]
MHMLFLYAVCATLIAATKAYEPTTNILERRLRPLDLRPDRETVSYLIPRLAAKYKPNDEWNGVKDPRFYLLSELESNNYDSEPFPEAERIKRDGLTDPDLSPSLSFVNSLDVLRNRLLLEIARRKQKEGMSRNRNFLSSVGKRAIYGQHRYDNVL